MWTFTRSDQRLTIQRCETEHGWSLILQTDSELPRTYRFESLVELVPFQSDMEYLLLQTGWSFASFCPERRTFRDRRTFPRVTDDRRRWWTDGER